MSCEKKKILKAEFKLEISTIALVNVPDSIEKEAFIILWPYWSKNMNLLSKLSSNDSICQKPWPKLNVFKEW